MCVCVCASVNVRTCVRACVCVCVCVSYSFVETILSTFLKRIILLSPVIPWALESWAEYEIRVFAKNGEVEKYANTEHALCVLNHRGDLDWMIGWVFIERVGMLGVRHNSQLVDSRNSVMFGQLVGDCNYSVQ